MAGSVFRPGRADATPKRGVAALGSRVFDVGVIGVYVILGLAIYWPLWPWTSTRLLGVGADPVLATWFLAWVPHALTHAANPLFSDALYAPLGINVAQNTSSPLLGVLTGLLAPLLSPVQRGNLVMILALPASASATYLVLRRWKVWAPAAAIGGLVYGFSPFEVGHAVGQLSLMFLPLPPLIAYTLVAIVAGRGSPIRRGLQLSILLAAQFLISAEIFVMCIVLLAVVLGSLALLHPAQAVHQFQRIFKPLAAAAILTGLIIAIPVWMVVFGPRHFSGPGHPVPSIYHTDLLSFLHPGWFQRYPLGISPLNLVGPTENTGYIGVPLLIVAVVLAWRSRRGRAHAGRLAPNRMGLLAVARQSPFSRGAPNEDSVALRRCYTDSVLRQHAPGTVLVCHFPRAGGGGRLRTGRPAQLSSQRAPWPPAGLPERLVGAAW